VQRQFFVCVFLFIALHSFSQSIETKGKDFYFTIPYGLNSEFVNASIIICSEDPVTGVLSTYKPYQQAFSINQDSCVVITLNSLHLVPYLTTEDTLRMKIKITTSDSVTVYCSMYATGADDASLILPVQSLGIEYQLNYFVFKFPTDAYSIITSELKNTIRVYTSGGGINTLSLDSNTSAVLFNPFVITRINSESDPPVPFAIFTGGYQSIGECNDSTCCKDLVFEQNLPDHFLGSKYISLPFKYGGNEITKLVALKDNTCININNSNNNMVLNEGESIDTIITGPLFIRSSKEISVSQFLRSNACSDFALGDPEYINVLPLTHFIKRSVFHTPIGYFPKFLVNVLTKTKDIGQVRLNGNSIRSQFSVVPSNTNYSYTQIEIDSGKHILESTEGFSATVYGLSGGASSPNSSAFYLGGSYNYSTPLPPPAVNFNEDTVICYGKELLLNGIDRNATYLWQDGSTDMNYTVTSPGLYYVDVTNDCIQETYRDTINVAFSSCGCSVVIPDIFSPNNDKRNDRLVPYSDCFFLNAYRLRIFDRYGFLIFESKDPLEYWDGKFKNVEVPDGIYIYDLSYKDGESPFDKQGTIAVIK
jgi:gliding motility-associated-like protein